MPDQEPRTGGVYPFDIALDRIDENGAQTVDGKWWPNDLAEALIDPNDPAVRERLWASLYVIAASSYSDGIDSSSPTNAEMDEIVADVLAALRSKP
jgi:hypothetical protein